MAMAGQAGVGESSPQSVESDDSSPADSDLKNGLIAIDKQSALPQDVDDPMSYLHGIYLTWVDSGGFVAGKIRNSVRQLVDLLGPDRQVKSIRPKLNGLTRLPRRDAESLLTAILENWEFREQSGKTPKGYTEISGIDIENVTKIILDAVYPPGSFEERRGILLPDASSHHVSSDETSPPKEEGATLARKLIPELFAGARTWITVSQQRTIIGRRSPAETIQGFANTIDTLWQVDEKTSEADTTEVQSDRILAWVLDIGNRDADLDDSYRSFFNMDFLACQFRSLRIIFGAEGEERWRWLDNKATFLVGKLTTEEIDRLYAEAGAIDLTRSRTTRWQNIDANHVAIGAVPSAWVPRQELRDLYGRHLEKVDDRTFTIVSGEHGKKTSSNGNGPVYVGYASGSDGSAFGRQLPSPGENYAQAADLIDMAARYRLGMKDPASSEREHLAALSRLRQIGFAVLRLSEFLNISKNLMD